MKISFWIIFLVSFVFSPLYSQDEAYQRLKTRRFPFLQPWPSLCWELTFGNGVTKSDLEKASKWIGG